MSDPKRLSLVLDRLPIINIRNRCYSEIYKLEFGGIIMSKMSLTEKKVIALAYFHRYGWIATMMVCMAI